MPFANDGRGGFVLLLALTAVALFAASRTAASAIAGARAVADARPGLRAFGYWLPVAITCIVALQLRRPEVAVALAFSTSVAALSFVLGVLTYIAPMDPAPPTRRAWPFVLPAALLALVAGFSGQLNWVHALAMLILGVAVFSAWREAYAGAEPVPAEPTAMTRVEATVAPTPRPAWLAGAEVVLACLAAVVGGWAAVTLATRAAATVPLVSTRLVATAVLTPLLVLPMLTAAPPERAQAHTGSMTSTVVAFVLMNLCVLLPLLTVAWHVGGYVAASGSIAQAGATQPAALSPEPMPFPLATWRVDAVVLTVLGFAMIPVGLGRWQLGRWEAIGLVAGYALYLAVSAAVSVRT